MRLQGQWQLQIPRFLFIGVSLTEHRQHKARLVVFTLLVSVHTRISFEPARRLNEILVAAVHKELVIRPCLDMIRTLRNDH